MSNKFNILVTWRLLNNELTKYDSLFKKKKINVDTMYGKQYLSEKNLIKKIHKYDGIICGDDEITKKVLDNVYSKGSETVEKFIFNLLPDGPGDTEVSIQVKQDNKPTGSIMFVRPFSIEDDSVLFYQAQFNNSYISGKNRKSINYGLGKRILSDDKSYFMGLNSFFDLDHKFNKRLSLGAELYASNFELNGNYYFGQDTPFDELIEELIKDGVIKEF